eukprot:scaffold99823_cov48-Phaeocystis_antarctica.AAC.2
MGLGLELGLGSGLGSGIRVKVRVKGPGAHHLAQHEDREDQPVAHLHARTRGAPLERGGPPGWGEG